MGDAPTIFIPPRKDIIGSKVVKIPHGSGERVYGIVGDASYVPPDDVKLQGGWRLLVRVGNQFDIWVIPEKDHPEAGRTGYEIEWVALDVTGEEASSALGGGSHELAGLLGFGK